MWETLMMDSSSPGLPEGVDFVHVHQEVKQLLYVGLWLNNVADTS